MHFSATGIYGFVYKTASKKGDEIRKKQAAKRKEVCVKQFRRFSCKRRDTLWWQLAMYDDVFPDSLRLRNRMEEQNFDEDRLFGSE